MKRKLKAIVLVTALWLVIPHMLEARVMIDAPHNSANNISCDNCHGTGILNSDFWDKYQSQADLDDTPINFLCLSCHDKYFGPYTETAGPFVATHSSKETESQYWGGSWTRQCIDCHNPHMQEQKNWYSENPTDYYVASGRITDYYYNSESNTTELTFDPDFPNPGDGITYRNGWSADKLSAKTSDYARTLIYPNKARLQISYPILEVDEPFNKILVKGDAGLAWSFQYPITPTEFTVLYGQLIKRVINDRNVKFFSNNGQNSFADGDATFNGVCEVCHTLTNHYQNDGDGQSHTDLENIPVSTDGTYCIDCHRHTVGFAHKIDGTGSQCGTCHNTGTHTPHLNLSVKCSGCHDLDNMWASPGVINDPRSRPDDPLLCDRCHNDGTGCNDNNTPLDLTDDSCTTPNATDYKANWGNGSYDLKCDGCHNGRPDTFDSDSQILWDSPDETYGEMTSNGHDRLIGETGVRQYPCWYCHNGTMTGFVDEFNPEQPIDNRWDNWVMTDKHVNGVIDVEISTKWKILGLPDPYYVAGTKNCFNTYCHSDGTAVNPEIREYPWDGGTQSCNSCHGHNSQQVTCYDPPNGCHSDDPDVTWTDEQTWLSAMPMYSNTGPGTDRANSHFKHLFSGFSCDDCHYKTLKGPCLDCHSQGVPGSGTLAEYEKDHLNGYYHVNKMKNIDFKDGGTYYRTKQGEHEAKSCANTKCHTGQEPVWGGSIEQEVTCLECHGTADDDVDDFGEFNDTRAKINLTEWSEAGHGRPELDENGDPNPYPSGKPAANFPVNGCWYCHDNSVVHKNNSNPFRLRLHGAFDKRFDKECAYCHMLEQDSDCLDCHFSSNGSSLAPQLEDIAQLIRPDHSTFGSQTSCQSVGCHSDAHEDVEDSDCLSCHDNINLNPAFIPQLDDIDEIEVRPTHESYNETTSCDTVSCHTDNETRHNLELPVPVEIQNRGEIEDIKNLYIMMGVCLVCHEDDSGGECSRCHVPGPGDPANKYDPGFDPDVPGLDRIQPKSAKASSFHFGYKHHNAYTESIQNIDESGSASKDSEKVYLVQDTTKSWTDNQWAGYTVYFTSGLNKDLSRKIKSNTADILTLDIDLPDLVSGGDTYEIKYPVWKGGKFCWDCHDPHGDKNLFSTNESDKYNIFMLQSKIATQTEGLFGKPIPSERKEVRFVRNQTGADYAKSEYPYNGVCNVCHDDSPGKTQHFNRSGGDGHNAARKCTSCHEHRFTDSHADEQDCSDCHGQNVKPAPRHTAFALPRDCTKCHDGTIKTRMNIIGQFRANSHHIQRADGTISNKDCYKCHWEATKEGLISLDYHKGYNYKEHTTTENDKVDLVVWGPGRRPTIYDPDGSITGTSTVTTYRATDLVIDLASERAAISRITPHCLSCHSDQNNDTESFDDCKTPRQYAWDGYSIDSKYSNLTTTTWGKYTGLSTAAEKNIVKAYSAHGNAVNNVGGFDPVTGVEGSISNTRAGVYNVQCFDCHSSHGSYVEGPSSSYITYSGVQNGANLKETQGGKGGYQIIYKASAWPDPNAVNFYNAGAGQCFDCHENENGGPSSGNSKPWGYNSTFGATEPIIGYRENLRFTGSYPGILESGTSETINPSHIPISETNVDLSYRLVRSTLGGHLNASHNNPDSSNYYAADPSINDIATKEKINGLCTPCHDPHGVSPTLGANMDYGVPLLKGTWLTSPYKDDHPPPEPYGQHQENYWGNPRNLPAPDAAPTEKPENRFHIDRTTFNDVEDNDAFISEDSEQFAGLCLRCHPKENLTNETVDDQNFRTVDRIHETVKGWGGANNEHYFPCSKCHQPHASGLPRLMATNCLDYNHRGGVESGGLAQKRYSGNRGYPIASLWNNSADHPYQNECHAKVDTLQNPDNSWPNKQLWNDVTTW